MTIQVMLSEMLDAVGFDAMAQDVLQEKETGVLRRYARIALANVPFDKRAAVRERFILLRLI